MFLGLDTTLDTFPPRGASGGLHTKLGSVTLIIELSQVVRPY